MRDLRVSSTERSPQPWKRRSRYTGEPGPIGVSGECRDSGRHRTIVGQKCRGSGSVPPSRNSAGDEEDRAAGIDPGTG